LKKPWQGRFSKDTARQALLFTASLPFDQRLAFCDIRGSIAHAEMLAACQIITSEEKAALVSGLEQIREEIEEDSFPFSLELEDIHMNIEHRLVEIIGPIGGKLHTGRSRNDQVALDMHLYLKEKIDSIDRMLAELQKVLINLAEVNLDVIMPGYTHLQRAQPVLFSHHLLAYFWMLKRDRDRLAGVRERTDIMPLGAGALAGTGFPVDAQLVAEKLHFTALYANSMDAVSDRDFIIEFISFASLLMMHLSRLCEELIIWSTKEFGFIEIDDAYTTGSSMMPQKKNPDVAELIRAKTGRVYGNLLTLLTVMKGLPLAYNKDMQEDKEGFFDTVDTLETVLAILPEMLATLSIDKQVLTASVDDDYLCATDLADYLVRKGLPFREAHHIVGKMIGDSHQEKIRLKDMPPEKRAKYHAALAGDIGQLLSPQRVVEARNSHGGTATMAVKDQLEKARLLLQR